MSDSIQGLAAGQANETFALLCLAYDQISGDKDARVCKDIPDAACHAIFSPIWLLAIGVFAAIREEPGSTEGGGNTIATALCSRALLKTGRALRRYVAVRGLLLSLATVQVHSLGVFARPVYLGKTDKVE